MNFMHPTLLSSSLVHYVASSRRRLTTAILIVVVIVLTIFQVQAQLASNEVSDAGLTLISERVEAADKGADFQDWRRVSTFTDGKGNTFTSTKTAYVEMQTGKHYLEDGVWKHSRALVEPSEGGAIARHGGHKVSFAGNAMSDVVVDLELPDGKHLRSRVLGLSYYDSASRKSVMFAQAADAPGVISGENQVVYAGAFSGVKADLRYTYRKAGLEQDVILRERPPTPESFGMDPKTTRLQVVTEFLSPPVPKQTTRTINAKSGAMEDEALDFGSMRMVPGKAFALGDGKPGARQATVAKRWTEVDGRTVLIEEMPLAEVKMQIEALPAQIRTSFFKSWKSMRQLASAGLKLPKRPAVKSAPRQMQFAKVKSLERGLVLDYVIVASSVTDYTFKGDTTYLISDAIYCFGSTTIEGGTVVKFAQTPDAQLWFDAAVDCKTAPYRYATFTSKDDDSVGESIVGSTGVPVGYYGAGISYSQGVWLGYSVPPLSYLRFRNLDTAITIGGDDAQESTLRNVQIGRCSRAVVLTGTLNLFNGLIWETRTNFISYGNDTVWNVQHATVDQTVTLNSAPKATISFVNSMLSNIQFMDDTGNSDINYLATPAPFTDSTVYASGGAGLYYLAANSPHRDVGTTAIDPELAAELERTTTHPPQVHSATSGTITIPANTTWWLHAARDTGTNPDRGYHYDPLDHLVANATLGGKLTIEAGVAVATVGNYGFKNGVLEVRGNPISRAILTAYSAVQEQPVGLGGATSPWYLLQNSSAPALLWKFADVNLGTGLRLGGGTVNNLDLEHCQLFGCTMINDGGSATKHTFTNNILERSDFNYAKCSGSGYEVSFCNNLFLNSKLGAGQYCYSGFVTSVSIHNNLFANSSFTYGTFSGQTPQIFNNGFHNSTATSQGTSPVSVGTLNFQQGPLGPYYYPASGGNLGLLLNAGSSSASSIGFDIYTTQPNHTPDSGTVDIGFHYFHGLPTTGKDFWIAFCDAPVDDQDANEPSPDPFTDPLYLSLYVSCATTAHGTLAVPGLIDQGFDVAPGTVTKLDVPFANALITTYNSIQNLGVHVTSDEPVSVYGVYFLRYASTAFTSYPTPLLGLSYCIMAYPGSSTVANSPSRSQFAIVATEANTSVNITPSANANLEGHPGTFPFTITLAEAGKTYQLRSASGDDVTGTRVASDKPIGVFGGAHYAHVPSGFEAGNPLNQQQLPIPSWGTRVVSFQFLNRARNGDFYRALAAYDNTEIRINGVVKATLQAGEFFENDVPISGPVEFTGSKPIQVAQLSHGGFLDLNRFGDPCEILLSPTDAYPLSHIVTTPIEPYPSTPNFSSFLNLIVEKAAIPATLFDGVPVAAASFEPIGATGYYGTRVGPVAAGTHTVSSSRPVFVQAYGFGRYDAYGYSGGAVVWPVR